MRDLLYSGKLRWRRRGGRIEVELESVQQLQRELGRNRDDAAAELDRAG
jgi:hypothetical protein